jgi:predicted carbohydrate-binding protein with CBM5 and CBM33 domain
MTSDCTCPKINIIKKKESLKSNTVTICCSKKMSFALNNLAPVYLQELVNAYQPTRALKSEDLQLLKAPRIRDESLQVSKKMTTDCTCPKINIIKKRV